MGTTVSPNEILHTCADSSLVLLLLALLLLPDCTKVYPLKFVWLLYLHKQSAICPSSCSGPAVLWFSFGGLGVLDRILKVYCTWRFKGKRSVVVEPRYKHTRGLLVVL